MGLLNRINYLFTGKNDEQQIGKRTFQMAKKDRLTNSWATSVVDVNQDMKDFGSSMRARARDLATNDPYGRKFLKMLEKNIVGPDGFTHRNKAFDLVRENGSYKKNYDKVANTIIEEAFADWSKKQNCSVTGTMSFREVCNVALKSMATDGEVFINKIIDRNNKYGFTLQIIDAQMCDESFTTTAKNGNKIVMGIEYDSYWKPIAYYFRTSSNSEYVYNSKTYVRLPASQIIHLYKVEFAGQLRGISWFIASAYRANVLKGYHEAVLINARSSAMKVGVLTPVEPSEISTNTVSGTEEDEATGDLVKDIEAGETYIVPEGYTFDTFNPTYPNGIEESFTNITVQGMASGFDVDFATLASNFSQVNYTSSRSALLDARAGFKIVQSYLIEHFLLDVRDAWLRMALLKDQVKLSILDLAKYDKPIFIGHKGEWVDQWKENKADSFAVENNLETLENVLGKRGYSLEEFIEQKKYEKQLLDEAGLSLNVVGDVVPPVDDEGDNASEEKHALNLELERDLQNYKIRKIS